MTNLNQYVFTAGSDEAGSDNGIKNDASSVVNTFTGNDSIVTTQGFYEPYRSWGIWNQGAIYMGPGRDVITGGISIPAVQASYGFLNEGIVDSGTGDDSINGRSENSNGRYAYGVFNHGSIRLGTGSDLVSGAATSENNEYNVGIFNVQDSLIDTGAGNDIIHGESGRLLDTNYGLLNYGEIDTGIGNDLIESEGTLSAIYNPGTIRTGDGADTLIAATYDSTGVNANGSLDNYNRIDMGGGADKIFCSGSRYGLLNNGVILFGDGNDELKAESVFPKGAAVISSGSINMGSGNDIVDAIIGGFDGSGTIDLGSGNDCLIGYGQGRFMGGLGVDSITLPSGTYAITSNLDGSYLIGNGMSVTGFEFFGSGADISSFSMAAATGSITFG